MAAHRHTKECLPIEPGHSTPEVDGIPIKEMTARQLHQYAEWYNWDGPEAPMRRIIRHPECDLGTAIMIFWLCAPHFYYEHTSAGEPLCDEEKGVLSLINEIVSKVRRGHFKRAQISFNPRRFRGYDMVYDEGDPNAIGIPDFMCRRVVAGRPDARLGSGGAAAKGRAPGRAKGATRKTTRGPKRRKKT